MDKKLVRKTRKMYLFYKIKKEIILVNKKYWLFLFQKVWILK